MAKKNCTISQRAENLISPLILLAEIDFRKIGDERKEKKKFHVGEKKERPESRPMVCIVPRHYRRNIAATSSAGSRLAAFARVRMVSASRG